MADNLHPIFNNLLRRDDRERVLNQKSKVLVVYRIGRGQGKSTIAEGLEKKLFQNGFFAQVLDGDNIRTGINKDLGFNLEDRAENIRRIAEIAKLYLNSGIITVLLFYQSNYCN